MSVWTSEELRIIPPDYGCNIIYANATPEQVKDTSLPSNAYVVTYKVDGVVYKDMCTCSKRVDIFNLYYDKFGSGVLINIDFGYGRVNPKLWGYKQPEKKKKK
jgi:hypothetical protein